MTTVLEGFVLYCVLLFAMRVHQKRAVSAMTPFELLLVLMIGGAVVPAILGADRSLAKAVLFIATVLGTHLMIAFLKARFTGFAKVVDGTPIIIVEDGHVHTHRMRKLLLTDEDILSSARRQGLMRLEQVRYAIVERNGDICVISKET